MASLSGRGFGWLPNVNAPTHLFSQHPVAANIALPPATYLTVPPSLDQSALGSCTAHGAAMAVAILTKALFWLARLMIYWGARKRLGPQYLSQDSGAMPDDALATIQAGEAGPENLDPYDIARFKQTPPAAALAAAKPHSIDFHDLDGDVVLQAKQAIFAGFPVNLGFSIRGAGVLQIDRIPASGMYPWDPNEPESGEGHDVLAVGYDDARKAFCCCNSWGQDWGVEIPDQPNRGRGCFWMPYAMFASSDVSDRAAVTNWK